MTTDTEYPSVDMKGLLDRPLNDIEERYAPHTIHYKGAMGTPLPGPRVSVVGTREPTETGLEDAKRVSRFLVENGIVVVSGLARGIDSMAHRTAIENGGKTVAVIGTPLNRTYPKENAGLQEDMMRNQMVVSQYPAGHTTTKRDFVFRNRTMALISDASIIVEAKDASGTLHHGWESIRLGRPLFICRSAFHRSPSRWPEEMTGYGAMEIDDMKDILEFLPPRTGMPELLHG